MIGYSPSYEPAALSWGNDKAYEYFVAGSVFSSAKGKPFWVSKEHPRDDDEEEEEEEDQVGGTGRRLGWSGSRHGAAFSSAKEMKSFWIGEEEQKDEEVEEGKGMVGGREGGRALAWEVEQATASKALRKVLSYYNEVYQGGEEEGMGGMADLLAGGSTRVAFFKNEVLRGDAIDLRAEGVWEKMLEWVPENMLTNGLLLQELRTNLTAAAATAAAAAGSSALGGRRQRQLTRLGRKEGGREGRGLQQEQAKASLYVGKGVEMCRACGMGAIEGPGSWKCDQTCLEEEEEGEVVMSEAGTEGRLPLGKGMGFDFKKVPYQANDLIVGEMELTTRGREVEGMTVVDLKDVVTAWVREVVEGGREGGGGGFISASDVQVAVYSTKPDALIAALYSSLVGESEEAGAAAECSTIHPFNLAFIAHDPTTASLLRNVLSGSMSESQDGAAHPLHLSLERALLSAYPAGEICDVALGLGPVFHVPAYNDEALTAARSTMTAASTTTAASKEGGKEGGVLGGVGGEAPLSIAVSDPAVPGVPLSTLMYGKEYVVGFNQFPPLTPLRLRLVGMPNGGEQEEGGGRALLEMPLFPSSSTSSSHDLSAKLVVMDEEGNQRLSWSLPPSLPPGDYYLQGTSLLGALGFSPLYTITGEEGVVSRAEAMLGGVGGMGGGGGRKKRRRLGPLLELSH